MDSNTTGYSNTAVGSYSSVSNTTSNYNTGVGFQTLQVSMGGANTALGAQAMLANTTASNNVSVGAFSMYGNTTGAENVALGTLAMRGNVSGSNNTALGYYTNISGAALTNATAIGSNAEVDASNSLVLGSISGVNSASSSTNVGIGTTKPTATLHVAGPSLLVTGAYTGVATGTSASGAGSRLMWVSSVSALRAGYSVGPQWDSAYIGPYSVAMGYGTKASQYFTTALGYYSNASGFMATAMGDSTFASGYFSTTMGIFTTASGYGSTAMGSNTVASGYFGTAMGTFTTASGYGSTAIGTMGTANGTYSTVIGEGINAPSRDEIALGAYNTTYTPVSGSGTWSPSDRLFSIGNGTSASATSNAMVILKNGNIGIGTSSPTYVLDVEGNSGSSAVAYFSNSNAGQYALAVKNSAATGGGGGGGIYGSTAQSFYAYGIYGNNDNTSGTGINGVGNGISSFYALAAGSGANFDGRNFGLVSWSTNTGTAASPAGGGYFTNHAGTNYAYVAYNNGTNYKILGTGTVSSIADGVNNEKVVLHAPETPEVYFQDYGEGQLTNGKAHISIDPIFAKNIVVNGKHPLRVFVQLQGDCMGVYSTNETQTGFDVVELQGGQSNVKFHWTITANRADEQYSDGSISKNADLRFEPAPIAPKAIKGEKPGQK